MRLPRRLNKFISLIFVIILFPILIMSCAPTYEPTLEGLVDSTTQKGLVDIGTHRLFIHCIGTGRPTVVLDGDIGETYETWKLIIYFLTLTEETRVCAYDRAGYGQSEPGPMPRDAQRAADELQLLLTASGEDGPYILVGHSLGGLIMQLYAKSYPEDVNGLVLLDPIPLAWIKGEKFSDLRDLLNGEYEAVLEVVNTALTSTDQKEQSDIPRLEALTSEFEALFGQTADEVAAIQSFGEIPLIVIGGTDPNPEFGESGIAFRQFWNEENQALAAKSAKGQFIVAKGMDDQIQWKAPHLVIKAILGMID